MISRPLISNFQICLATFCSACLLAFGLYLLSAGMPALAAAEPISVAAPAASLEDAGAGAQQALQNSAQPASQGAECLLSAKFPAKVLRWCGLIQEQARAQGIAPDLLASLIWLESGGNPSAISRDGAVGLMQVMPRDGKAATFMCLNGPCFAARPTIKRLKDPQFNVEYGARMLANLIKRHGELRAALKAYGPAGVGFSYADSVLGIYQRTGGK